MALLEAAKNGNLEEVKRLLANGANLNEKNSGGWTALHYACTFGRLNVATYLLDQGAPIDLQENDGEPPLYRACVIGHANIVSLLLGRGANPSIKDKKGKTALDIAKERSQTDCVRLLQNLPPPIPTRQQQQREQQEQEERRRREREIEEQKQREKQQEIEENKRNRELVSSLSTQLQRKDEEILVLKDRLTSREDSLRNSEQRIRNLENEKNQAIARIDKLEKDMLKEKEKFESQINVLSKQMNSSQSNLEERDRLMNTLQSEKKLLEDKVVKIVETNRVLEEQLKDMVKKMETKDQLLVEKETLLINLRDELSRCGFQLGELKTKLECSENEIANLREELDQKSERIEKDVGNSSPSPIQELKDMVVQRYREQRVLELNKARHQKYLELNDKIKKTKDRRTIATLTSELSFLNYNPKQNNVDEPLEIIPLEQIESQAKELYHELTRKEDEFMSQGDIEASMLCEIDRLHVVNLLKVFEVEIDLGLEDDKVADNGKDNANDNQEINDLRGEVTKLNEEINQAYSELAVKEEELKKCEFELGRFQRKRGIGFNTPHVRFLDIGPEYNLKDMSRCVNGVFQNLDGNDFDCKLKVVFCPNEDEGQLQFQEQLMKLEREKVNLEMIRRRDPQHESSKFIVNWLFPSQLLSEENIYFVDKLGDQLFQSDLQSQRMRGLVFESGGMNLREYLKNHTLHSVPMTQRVHILEEIVEAVRFLHKLEMVHFDLKPENIVLFGSGDSHSTKMRWKLIDFDSSYDEKSSPLLSGESRNVWLTEEFVCPEVLRALFPLTPYSSPTSKSHSHTHSHSQSSLNSPFDTSLPINWRMDIWSLGLVAFFILTNRSFWSEHSSSPFNHSMVTRITQEEIQLVLSRAMKHCDKEKSFVESCLQVDPASRWSGTKLLEKTIFTTGNSTIHSSSLKFTKEIMMERFDEIQRLLKDHHEESSLSVSDELGSKFEDLYFCLKSLNEMKEG